jgi:hypothetical protein
MKLECFCHHFSTTYLMASSTDRSGKCKTAFWLERFRNKINMPVILSHLYFSQVLHAQCKRRVFNAPHKTEQHKNPCLTNNQTAANASFEVEIAVCRHSTAASPCAHNEIQMQSLVLTRTLTQQGVRACASGRGATLSPHGQIHNVPSSSQSESACGEGRSRGPLGAEGWSSGCMTGETESKTLFRSKQKTSAQNGCFPVSPFVE